MQNSTIAQISPRRTAQRKTFADVLTGWMRIWSRLYRRKLIDEDFTIYAELLRDLDAEVLERACRAASKDCKFFPTPAEILERLRKTEGLAAPEAAEEAWTRVLEIRRVHWNPDIPGPFHRALAGLSDRVRQAARAAGIFREFTAAEFENGALHTWAKKRFVESFIAYGELLRDEFLLPDGELKNLLADAAQQKALPDSQETWQEMRARGLAYAAQLSAEPPRRDALKPRFQVVQSTRSLEEQKRILREKGFAI